VLHNLCTLGTIESPIQEQYRELCGYLHYFTEPAATRQTCIKFVLTDTADVCLPGKNFS